MFIQVRRSGTDAKLRGYANGESYERSKKYLEIMVHYLGNRTTTFNKYISIDYQANVYLKQEELYKVYMYKGL